MNLIRGDVKKKEFWVVGAVWGGGAQSQLSVKNYHFLFLLPFDAEAFKTCKTQYNFLICVLHPVWSEERKPCKEKGNGSFLLKKEKPTGGVKKKDNFYST